jgi:hypothetical protein
MVTRHSCRMLTDLPQTIPNKTEHGEGVLLDIGKVGKAPASEGSRYRGMQPGHGIARIGN